MGLLYAAGISAPVHLAEEPDDAVLVADARRGDQAALERLLRRHYDPVYAVCRRLCGNEADALDAAQEAMIAVLRGLPRFDGRARVGTWIYRVATNAALDELRRRRRRPLPAVVSEAVGPSGVGGRPDVLGDGVGDGVAHRLDVDAALGLLPPDLRAAVVLRDLAGLAYGDIADVLGVPAGTVRSRIARGRARLADRLRASHPADGARR